MTAAPVLAKSFKLKVTITSGDSSGQSHLFDKPVVTIGRGPENDVVFPNDPKMSRVHVEVHMQLGQFTVRNVSQKNPILINGEKAEEKILTAPATLLVGETTIQIAPDLPIQDPAPMHLVPTSDRPLSQPPPSNRKQSFSAAPLSSIGSAATSVTIPAPQSMAASSTSFNSPPRPSRPQAVRPVASGGGSRLKFYGIILVIGALLYFLLSGTSQSKKNDTHLRTEGDVVRAIEQSAQAVQELKKQQSVTGQDSLQYKAAQEHYIKGFRDYRQGQYARAMQSFQAALSFYPNHELARKYLLQSQRKFEALIDSSMAQGRKYYQKQNYKMCESSFANVMIMVKDPSKPKYQEAKQFYDECSLRNEGNY